MNVRRVAISALVAAGLLLGLAPGPRAQAEAPETGGQVGALVLLGVDQIVGVDTGAISSDIPNFFNGPRGAQAADDIVVTTAATNVYWIVQQITVGGANVGAPAISAFNVIVYSDSGNLPGNVYALETATSFSGAPNYVIGAALALPGSPTGRKYWLSVQARVTSTDLDFWNWQSGSSGGLGNTESVWRETVGTSLNFGTCAMATGIPNASGWGRRRTQCSVGVQDNMAFRLDGQIVTLSNQMFLPVIHR